MGACGRAAEEGEAVSVITKKDIHCCCPLLEISYLDKTEIKYIRRTYRDGYCFSSEVDIPPHGRLIDADELIERAYRLKLDSRELIVEMINNAPTIIPPGRK